MASIRIHINDAGDLEALATYAAEMRLTVEDAVLSLSVDGAEAHLATLDSDRDDEDDDSDDDAPVAAPRGTHLRRRR